MHLSIKSALPFALVASPLLLAATRPPMSEAALSVCGADTINASFTSAASTPATLSSIVVSSPDFSMLEMLAPTYEESGADAVEQGQIVHPVAASLEVLITSEQEWESLVNAPQSTTRFQNIPRLFIESPYGPEATSSIEFVDSEALTEAQTRCNLKEDPSTAVEPDTE